MIIQGDPALRAHGGQKHPCSSWFIDASGNSPKGPANFNTGVVAFNPNIAMDRRCRSRRLGSDRQGRWVCGGMLERHMLDGLYAFMHRNRLGARDNRDIRSHSLV